MKNLIPLVSLAIAIAIGYWLYESLSEARDKPKELIEKGIGVVEDVVEGAAGKAEEAVNIVSGKGTAKGKNLGESCLVGPDCKGYLVGNKQGNACCEKICTTLKKDYAGTYWCPSKCKKSLLAKKGSC